MELLSDFIESNVHPLRELDISHNVEANSKGLLILFRACKHNSHLRRLKANDCAIQLEVLFSLINLVEAQQKQ